MPLDAKTFKMSLAVFVVFNVLMLIWTWIGSAWSGFNSIANAGWGMFTVGVFLALWLALAYTPTILKALKIRV